jgi:ribonuclease P protein component
VNGHQPHPLQKFPKSSRLLKHADFQAVYQEGRKHFSGNITVFYRRRNDIAGPRVGFTVGKVLGGAVERNRIRRRMRAAVQRHLAGLLMPLDVIMHPRKSVLSMDFAHLDAEVGQILTAIQKGRTTR